MKTERDYRPPVENPRITEAKKLNAERRAAERAAQGQGGDVSTKESFANIDTESAPAETEREVPIWDRPIHGDKELARQVNEALADREKAGALLGLIKSGEIGAKSPWNPDGFRAGGTVNPDSGERLANTDIPDAIQETSTPAPESKKPGLLNRLFRGK